MMAPGLVEQATAAAQTNDPPNPESGLLKPSQGTADAPWTPETVLSTLQQRPHEHSPSPVPFLHLIARLKTTKREGWRRFGLDRGESIADHMYRMGVMTLLCPPSLSKRIDLGRATRMALVHDMAEALVGDITPVDGVVKSEKNRREAATMDYLCDRLLGNVFAGEDRGEAARGIREVWQEYEDNVTLEAKFVHDVDKMELLLQMVEYEREHEGGIDLGEFSWVARRIELDEIKGWCRDVLKEREEFWKGVGKEPSGNWNTEEEEGVKSKPDSNGGR